MASYDIDQLHGRILRILLAVDDCCRQHHLRCYIWAGTMLGAVRHHGFIPWDDDIDIAMPRPDYEQLIAHCREWLPQPYEFVCAENDASYPLPFGKVQDASTTLIERTHLLYLGGIYIDVFPIDGMTPNWLKQRIHFARYSFYKKIIYLLCRDPYKHGHGPSCWLPLLCRRCFTLKGVLHRLLALQKKYADHAQELVVDHDFGMRGIMPPSVYGNPQEVEFEGHVLCGVEQADCYLSKLYGDYMTIPPGDKQRQHNFYFLDYHLPYREYQDHRDFL